VLGSLLADRIDLGRNRPQLLLPAPLHPRRLRERGFNQAAELTRILADELSLPWSARHFVRVRHTEPQAGLDRRARQRNLRHAFRWRGPIGDLSRVAVIDDVVTTGTTAEEMARALKRAGIERVEVWAVARTPD
jgi:ComF family protein